MNRILVVEDHDMTQYIAQLIFKRLGHEIDIAKDGQSAIDLFQQQPYQLILMDLGLPDIDGFDVTKRIRALEEEGSHASIVALTANFAATYRPICLASGMDGFYSKPLTQVKGQDILDTYLVGQFG